MLRAADLEYELPAGMIATRAAEPRDAARLCVVARGEERAPVHAHVRDLPRFLRAGDLLVLNTTSVLPAWIEGTRVGTGGKFTGLYLAPASAEAVANARSQHGHAFDACWNVMLKGGHLRPGALLEARRGERAVMLELLERVEGEAGAWVVGVVAEAGSRATPGASPDTTLEATLGLVGQTPIPPYIRKARQEAGETNRDDQDRGRYQTVFADAGTIHEGLGSVAAPTAGLHFTPELLERLRAMGVRTASVVLHVGTGTFRPVESEIVEDHPMHAEWCSMETAAIEAIRETRARGGRVICVGTTSARVVETFATREEAGPATDKPVTPGEWVQTRILITPGYRWKWVDGLLTNFHLPRSTLMAMVAALLESDPGALADAAGAGAPPAGVRRLLAIYAEAMREGYRFYSFGDAMLVLPGGAAWGDASAGGPTRG